MFGLVELKAPHQSVVSTVGQTVPALGWEVGGMRRQTVFVFFVPTKKQVEQESVIGAEWRLNL
jgi:hypothetical protein